MQIATMMASLKGFAKMWIEPDWTLKPDSSLNPESTLTVELTMVPTVVLTVVSFADVRNGVAIVDTT